MKASASKTSKGKSSVKSAKAKAPQKAKATAKAKVAAKPKAAAKAVARAAAKPKAAVKAKRKAAAKPAKPVGVQAVPAGYGAVTPCLNIDGAEKAIEFYKQAFGAVERFRMPGPGGKIMHAEIAIGDSVVMLADAIRAPATQSMLHIYVGDCDALFSKALAAGATTTMPLQDMFWGDRFGQVTDPFGNVWSIATHKEDVAPDEMQARMSAAVVAAPPAANSATAQA